jgi:hypothetical protein
MLVVHNGMALVSFYVDAIEHSDHGRVGWLDYALPLFHEFLNDSPPI